MADTAYRFGPFHLDVRERRLSRGGEVIPLRLKVFDTLLVLVENAGRLVTKQTLLDRVWPETTVEENNLNHNVSVLRKALGEKATGQQYIETVPRVGYRFAAPVDAAATTASTSNFQLPTSNAQLPTPNKVRQEIRYCTTSDGVRVAYATTGNGPPLVKASNWLTHLDFEWGSPIWRHWYTALSLHHRLVRYDERGNGMSQRDRVRGEASRARDSAGALRRIRSGTEPRRHAPAARGAARARESVAAWVGTQQPGVLQDVHLSVHPRGDPGARALVRRTPAGIHLARKCGAAHGA